jgi:catechol 2,3-dioxygenase-like lactoylglutathione lyase family enzyme
MTSVCVIGIYVHDMEQALDFYCNKLGFKVKQVYDKDCLIQLENDGPTLILEKVDNPSNPKYPGGSQFVLCIEAKNLEQTAKKLEAMGVQFLFNTPQPFPEGIFMATRDPSGNLIEILQFKEE